MAVTTHRFGRTGAITAHFCTQVGAVGREHEPSPDQSAQRTALARLYADFVAAAESSVWLAVYDLRLSGEAAHLFLGALNARAQGGVDVRIAYQPAAGGGAPAPAPLAWLDPAISHRPIAPAEQLAPPIQAAPIGVGHPLMHSKYLVRDAGTPQAAVLTGSANLTNDAWSVQDNNIVVFERAPALAHYYANDFSELWSSGRIATTGRLDSGLVDVDGLSVAVAFSPGQGRQIDAEIAGVIAAARTRVLVAAMVISSATVLGALFDRCRGVADFGGIVDGPQMRHIFRTWAGHASGQDKAALLAALAPLLHAKDSIPYHPDTPHNFMHNKLVVCDDRVITGSFNFSASAMHNAENVVVIRAPEVADAYAAYVRQLTRLYPRTGLSDT